MIITIDTAKPLTVLERSILRMLLENLSYDAPAEREPVRYCLECGAAEDNHAPGGSRFGVCVGRYAEDQGGDTDLAEATESGPPVCTCLMPDGAGYCELHDGPQDEPEVDLEALRATAVAKATELLSNGQAAKVRKALDGRARKVSELTDNQLQAFVDAL